MVSNGQIFCLHAFDVPPSRDPSFAFAALYIPTGSAEQKENGEANYRRSNG
jgi:hypothetical protein